MKISREEVIELADKAGYSIQQTGYIDSASNKVVRWRKDVWGGSMETSRLHRFAQLLIAKMEAENGSVPA